MDEAVNTVVPATGQQNTKDTRAVECCRATEQRINGGAGKMLLRAAMYSDAPFSNTRCASAGAR
jgi:hypothetical protein